MSALSRHRYSSTSLVAVRIIATAFAAVYLTACQNDTSAISGSPEERSPAPASTSADAKQTPQLEIARRIAVALEDETVRAALTDAIRASRWQEQKLDLHEFVLNGPPRVREALAAHNPVESDRALLGRLGSMDLYFPIEGQVESRTGKPVTVVAVSDPDATRGTVIDAHGRTREVTEKDIPSLGHMLVVHPAEPRSPRSLAPFASLVNSASSSCAGTIAAVRLTYFRILRGDGPFGGANEMEFRGRQLDINGVPGTGVTYAVGGISTNRDYFPNVSLGCVGFFSGSFSHQIWEMDGGPSSANQNDFFGGRVFPPTSYNVAVLYSDSSVDYGFATISNP